MSDLSISNLPVAGQFLKTEHNPVGVASDMAHPSAPAKDFMAQVLHQSGGLTALLSGQSLMTDYSNDKTVLAEPAKGSEKINAEVRRALVRLSDNLKRPADDHKLDQLAASASTLFTSQINTLQANGKSSERAELSGKNSAISLTSDRGTRPHSTIENGTDITAAQGSGFINVVGDMTMLATLNTVTTTLSKAEAIEQKSSALASQRVVNSAEHAGQKGIDAAIQRRTGAISSGLVGLAGHTMTTRLSLKALRNEKVSINNNLKGASKLEKSLSEHRIDIKTAENLLAQKGQSVDQAVKDAMTASHPEAAFNISNLRDNHSLVQNKTQRTRSKAEYGNQAINSTQSVIDKGQDVAAAGESKQADLARADQAVNNELSNTHQQTAKKAHDSRTSIEQTLEGALNSNSNAASVIAGNR